ncbi:hypothetical protein [Tunturiibacter psychrotolerans]|uniref:hypothetical protein n=1 Tax=Tunturiibacter psychrotolerans TaxID=3069686 RepID=UPI003D19E89D
MSNHLVKKKAKKIEMRTDLTIGKIVGWAGGTLGIVASLIAIWPRMTIIVSEPVDPENAMSASVTITNTGFIPLLRVRPLWELHEMTFGDPSNPSKVLGDKNMIRLTNTWAPKSLNHDDEIEFGLNDIWGNQPYMLSADGAIVVEYRLPLIPHSFSRVFPVIARKQTDQKFHWYAQIP